jgi:hypothetical protein
VIATYLRAARLDRAATSSICAEASPTALPLVALALTLTSTSVLSASGTADRCTVQHSAILNRSTGVHPVELLGRRERPVRWQRLDEGPFEGAKEP